MRDTSVGCPDQVQGSVFVSGNSLSYTVTALEEDSVYNITLQAMNSAGSTYISVDIATLEASE